MKTIQVAKIDDEHPIDTAARMIGGRAYLAKKLDVSVAAVGNWKQRGVPIEKCPGIESLTCGAVSRRDLRPDDWQKIWPELAPAQSNQPQQATQAVAPGV